METNDVETGVIRSQLRRTGITRVFTRLCSPIFLQAFTLTFLAEWGDRSQLTTIILGSREVSHYSFVSMSVKVAVLDNRFSQGLAFDILIFVAAYSLHLVFLLALTLIPQWADWPKAG